MIQIDQKLLEYAQKYADAFGSTLPLRMIPQVWNNETLYKMIDDCIARNTDDLAGQFVDPDEEVLIW